MLRVERRRYTTCSSVVKHGKAAWRDAINTQERLGGGMKRPGVALQTVTLSSSLATDCLSAIRLFVVGVSYCKLQ